MDASKNLLISAVKPLLSFFVRVVKITSISGGVLALVMIAPSYAITIFASGLRTPEGEAFDSSGNLYVANNGNNSISKITSAGAISTFVSSGLNSPIGVAFDSSGNLYITNVGNSSISKITSVGAISTFVSSGLSVPTFLAISGNNLYESDVGSDSINEFSLPAAPVPFEFSSTLGLSILGIFGIGKQILMRVKTQYP